MLFVCGNKINKMKLNFVSLCGFLLVVAVISDESVSTKIIPKEFIESTFLTRLDHFRSQDSHTVAFNYNANFEHYAPGGPFYINLKDGGDPSIRWIENGLMVDIARNTSGALFTFDYRYTGNNIPTESATLEDLQFLSIDQILADVATFVRQIHDEFDPENAAVITYGSGYGGTLAALARKKYPHLIDAAWSSSGIFRIELSSFSLYDLLSDTFSFAEEYACRNSVRNNIFYEIDALVEADEGGRIQGILNLCNSVDTESVVDVGNLFVTLIESIIDFFAQNHLPGIQSFCNAIDVVPAERLNAFANWLTVHYGNECRDISYGSLVQQLSNTSWDQPGTLSGRRQWYYLQCTQNALFQITDEVTWLPNRIQMAYHVQKCQDIFGEDYAFDLMREVNIGVRNNFGSGDQRITNIIYTSGYLDPWEGEGMWYVPDRNAFAYRIYNYSKSADFPSIQEKDLPNLVQIKNLIFDQIVGWSNIIN